MPEDNPRKFAIVVDAPNRKLALRYKEWVKDMPVEVFTDLGSAKE